MSAKFLNPITRVVSVLLIVMIALTVLPASPAAAASSVMMGTAGANLSVGSNYNWNGLTNLATNNNSFAYVNLPADAYSNRLYVSGFQFSIPAGATIEGFQVGLPRKASNPNYIQDVAISLVRNGEVVGTPKSVDIKWPNTETVQLYGDASDNWGVTDWAPEDINAQSFGVSIEVQNSGESLQSAQIDYVRVTVTYSYATTITIAPLTVRYGDTSALSATLTPAMAGKSIAFTLNGAAACSATTDALGAASCIPATAFTQNAGTYTGYIGATYAGEGDYRASSAVTDLIVVPRPITVTAQTETKVYDGTTASAGEPTITDGALVGGDTATWIQSFEDKNVGTLKTISPDGEIQDGNNGANYDVTFISVATGEITPKPITVSAVADIKEYDGTPDSDVKPTITAGALASGDTANFSQSFVNEHAGINKDINPAGIVNDGNNGSNYKITFVQTSGKITQRPIDVTAAVDSKVYDGTTTSDGIPTITKGELAIGDKAVWWQGYDSKHAGGTKLIMPSGVITDGNNGENYYVIYRPVTGEITPKPITISALDDTKPYDGTIVSARTPQLTSGSLVAGDLPYFRQEFENANAGTEKIIYAWCVVADGNGGSNYTMTIENATGSITKRSITVTAVTDSKEYDGTTSSSGVPTVTEGELVDGQKGEWFQRFEDENAGDQKTIIPDGNVQDGNGGSNYNVEFISVATGEITPRPITVTARPGTKEYDGTPDSMGIPWISSGALFITDSAVWTQAFENEHTGTGKTIIPAGEIEDGNNGDNYVVTLVNATGTITPRPITVTAVTDTKVYDGTKSSSKVPQVTTGELAIGDSGTWTQIFDNENAGIGKTITPSGEIQDGNNGGNYAVTLKPVQTGVITPRAITVSALGDSKVYDGTTASALEPEITSGSLVSGDTPAFTQVFATRNAGTDIVINPAGKVNDGNNGGNYAVTLVSATGTITQRSLTVTAVTDTKTYDGTNGSSKDPQITAGSIASGDSEAFFQAFDNQNAGSEKIITPDGKVDDDNDGDNYVVTFVPVNTGEINKLAITVTANEITRQFGTEDPELTFSVNPVLATGDSFTGGLTREEGSAVGAYAILIGTLSAGDNYELTFLGADLTITKADQTITVTQHAPASAIEGTTFEVAAESSSGLAVTYSSSGACTNAGGVYTMTSATGTCQVIIDQAGDESYNPAPTIIEEVTAGEIEVKFIYLPHIVR